MIAVTRKANGRPAITLFLLTPIISELLFGSTPASRAYSLIIECLLYGPAALLIREYVRRKNLGWLSIVLLGTAFGLLLEGVLLQSVFSPLFIGIDLSFGRKFEVNWFWGESIIGYHSGWSIMLPILITELIYPGKRNESWLKTSGVYFNTGLGLSGCFVHFYIFYKMSGYIASPVHFSIVVCLMAVIFLGAGRFKINGEQERKKRRNWYWTTGIIAFTAGAIWLTQIMFVALRNPSFAPLPTFLLTSLTTVFLVAALSRLLKNGAVLMQQFSIAAGMLTASMLFGLIVLAGAGNRMDMYFHLGFIIIVIFLLWKLKKRLIQLLTSKLEI